MTSYTTCTNCAADKHACDRRASVRAAIKGFGITSVKFQCSTRIARFQPGQRVEVCWPVYDDCDGMPNLESWKATVIAETGSRFVIKVDDADSGEGTPARSYLRNQSLFAKVPPSRLSALDEPSREICSWCGDTPSPHADASDCIEYANGAWGSETAFCPPKCILSPRASQASPCALNRVSAIEAGRDADREPHQ